jgi:hypothetical protein
VNWPPTFSRASGTVGRLRRAGSVARRRGLRCCWSPATSRDRGAEEGPSMLLVTCHGPWRVARSDRNTQAAGLARRSPCAASGPDGGMTTVPEARLIVARLFRGGITTYRHPASRRDARTHVLGGRRFVRAIRHAGPVGGRVTASELAAYIQPCLRHCWSPATSLDRDAEEGPSMLLVTCDGPGPWRGGRAFDAVGRLPRAVARGAE